MFNTIHGLTHLGKRSTFTAVSSEIVWPCMNKDITNWCKLYLDCHKSKVSQLLALPCKILRSGLPFRPSPYGHCRPLPPSQGIIYLFTIINRFTRWTEAIPMTDSTAPKYARVFFLRWISRFGVPGEMTSECGP